MKNNLLICLLFLVQSFLSFHQATLAQLHPAEFMTLLDSANRLSGAQRWDQASSLWHKITLENPVRGDFWMNLGDACYQTKSYQEAILAYGQAFELGWELPCFRALNIAECFGMLNQKDSCYFWLKTALEMGYPYLDDLKKDSAVSKYYRLPEFKKLLWLKERFNSPIEGWNYDLDFLDWQIKRVAFNPYRRYSKEDFQRQEASIRKEISSGAADAKIIASFVRLLAMVGDGHTKIYAFFERKPLRWMIPLYLEYYHDGLFVVAADHANADLLGWRVDQIDGIPLDTVVKRLIPYTSYDNSTWMSIASLVRLQSPPFLHAIGLTHSADSYFVTLTGPQGVSQKRKLYALERDSATILDWAIPSSFERLQAPPMLRNKFPEKSFWFEKLPGSRMVYFKFNSVSDDSIESLNAFSRRLFNFIDSGDVSQMVIDMRDNSGGNVYLVDSLVKRTMMCKKINRPGGLFCLISPLVFSAAQMFTVFLENNTNITFVGEPTGSRPNFVGETGLFHLPYSQVQGSISNLFWEYAGAYDSRTWIGPQVLIYSHFSSRLKGVDEVLDAALSLASHP